MTPKTINHFSTLVSSYDAFLLDLWGVVHDGTAMYPGAKECMAELQRLGKQVVMISNAPRRAAKAQAVLDTLEVPKDYYQAIYTSGEVGYQHIKQGKFDVGERYVFIGPERDADVLDGLGKRPVADVAQVDFLLNVGFGSEQEDVAEVQALLEQAASLKLPMLCLNPDLYVVKITGERYECAGVIAEQYKDLGGQVHYFGKPYPQVYEMAHQALGHIDKSRILAIGDGLDTDIRGAVSFGVDSLLITGGILKGSEAIDFTPENTPTYRASVWSW